MSKTMRLDNLDLLRGLAAFLVLAGHLRAYIFQGFTELMQPSLLTKAFYFITGFGHQAVMIFFALSGFLVGGNALDDIVNQRFSWSRYLLRRLTRLWIVIIPALLLTFLLDNIGLMMTHGTGYDGRYYAIYSSGPRGSPGVDHSLVTFLGNLTFLQTVYVPTYGSNGPMWSLANEFWYYVVFPLTVWVGIARQAVQVRIAGLFLLLLLIMVIPMWLLSGGIIWAAGAAAAWYTRRPGFEGVLAHYTMRIGAVTLFFAALALSKLKTGAIGDLELGVAVALTLPVLANLPSPGGIYSALTRGSSEISYTLYLTHFPLITLIILADLAPERLQPSASSALLYVALISTAITWAGLIWWCFERNTDRVYSLIARTWLAQVSGITPRVVGERRL
jgi:peptidoglycan/LPS O-acetylase OafA/YrhL